MKKFCLSLFFAFTVILLTHEIALCQTSEQEALQRLQGEWVIQPEKNATSMQVILGIDIQNDICAIRIDNKVMEGRCVVKDIIYDYDLVDASIAIGNQLGFRLKSYGDNWRKAYFTYFGTSWKENGFYERASYTQQVQKVSNTYAKDTIATWDNIRRIKELTINDLKLGMTFKEVDQTLFSQGVLLPTRAESLQQSYYEFVTLFPTSANPNGMIESKQNIGKLIAPLLKSQQYELYMLTDININLLFINNILVRFSKIMDADGTVLTTKLKEVYGGDIIVPIYTASWASTDGEKAQLYTGSSEEYNVSASITLPRRGSSKSKVRLDYYLKNYDQLLTSAIEQAKNYNERVRQEQLLQQQREQQRREQEEAERLEDLL